MANNLKIFKIGGNVINNPERLSDFLHHFSLIKTPTLLVHGGGRAATEMQKKLGQTPIMIKGRRVTDKDTIDVVTMVYAGLINKKITAQLGAFGKPAVGLSGADAGLMHATKRPPLDGVDYGYAGEIKSINTDFLSTLINAHQCPVICPITCHTPTGQLLNTNADTIAAQIAIGLCNIYKVEMYFCFEKPGVLTNPNDDGSVIKKINRQQYKQYNNEGIIADGMLPKLHNAFGVAQAGASKVLVVDAEVINRLANNLPEGGTLIEV